MTRKRKAASGASTLRVVPQAVPSEPTVVTGAEHPANLSRLRTRTIVIASGKGGVGKSNLAANLAVALGERGANVLLVDGDLAQANLDLLLGLHPRWDLSHVLDGQKTIDEIVVNGPPNVRLVPAASGASDLADLDDFRREALMRALGTIDGADLVIVDTGSGVSKQTLSFCRAAHELLVVTTPEMTSFSDAYALVKLLQQQGGMQRAPRLVMNLAAGEEAEETAHRFQLVARRFLRVELECLGVVPEDPAVPRAVRLQEPVVKLFPQSPAALAYRSLAAKLWKPLPSGPQAGRVTDFRQRLEA